MFATIALFVTCVNLLLFPNSVISSIVSDDYNSDDDAWPAAIVLVFYPSDTVRVSALNALAISKYGYTPYVKGILHVALFDPEWTVRCEALDILHQRHMTTLLSIRIADSQIMSAAAGSEQVMSIHVAIPVANRIPGIAAKTAKLLDSPDSSTQIQALRLAEAIGTKSYRSIGRIVTLTQSNEARVRAAALRAIISIVQPCNVIRYVAHMLVPIPLPASQIEPVVPPGMIEPITAIRIRGSDMQLDLEPDHGRKRFRAGHVEGDLDGIFMDHKCLVSLPTVGSRVSNE